MCTINGMTFRAPHFSYEKHELLLDWKINLVTNRTINLFWGAEYQPSPEQKHQHTSEKLPPSLCMVVFQRANIFRESNKNDFLVITCDSGKAVYQTWSYKHKISCKAWMYFSNARRERKKALLYGNSTVFEHPVLENIIPPPVDLGHDQISMFIPLFFSIIYQL